MSNITIKYVNTSVYNVTIGPDNWPEDWADYTDLSTIEQFCTKDISNYSDISNYTTINGKIEPAIQAKIKAGKMFSFTFYRYSGTDGGFYKYPEGRLDANVDGYITLHNDLIKGLSYDERLKIAESELASYTDWANNGAYYVSITDSTGRDVATCGGFIGDDAVKQFIAESIPDAINNNVNITGQYYDGGSYDVYFNYDDCIKAANYV